MKRACVLLAKGFEEIEALTPVDYLRRAGVEVTTLGVGGRLVPGARGVPVEADRSFEEAAGDTYDAVIIPGGMPGAKNLAENAAVVDFIRRHFAQKHTIAAICAAPAVVLHGACGILAGKRFTGYPGTESQVAGAVFTQGRVVTDGTLITSRGPGTAGEFAIAIASALVGEAAARRVAEGVLLSGN